MIRTLMGLSVVAAVSLVACGPDAGGGAGSGSASAKKSAAPSAAKSADAKPSASAAASAATSAATPAKPEVLATCTNKDAGTCVEHFGAIGAKAEEECVGKDKKGEFKKGSEACTHTDAVGTCEEKLEGTNALAHHFFKPKFDEAAAKKICDDRKGTWIPEPAAAPATSGAASAAPVASGAASAAPK
jgi:hypothetical protein